MKKVKQTTDALPPYNLDAEEALLVAKELNRKSIYIDVSEKYCEMAKKRISKVPLPMELNL